MKKQYIFLIMIWIILYVLYLILSFTYREYKINSHIEYITSINQSIKDKIKEAEKIIDYKSSKSYRNKILKEQQSYKNSGENVIYLTTEKVYNKFAWEPEPFTIMNIEEPPQDSKLDTMSVYEKWMYFIFKIENY